MARLLRPPIPDSGRPQVHWSGLHGSATALALAEAAAADDQPWLVIEPDSRSLERRRAELQFFAPPGLRLLTLPDWEVLPYDVFSPHPDITSDRLLALAELPDLRRGLVLVTIDTILQRLAPRQYVASRSFSLAVGERLALEAFRLRLTEAGYSSVSQVASPGEYALRGSLLDVFPMGADGPLRIDLFDDEIEAIRKFDPETQRSRESIPAVRLLPAREMPLDTDAVRAFRRRYRTRFDGDPTRSAIYRGVSDGIAPAGIEFYLPLFFDSTDTLLDYLPSGARIADLTGSLDGAIERAWQGLQLRHDDRCGDIERPLLRPEELFIDLETIQSGLDRHPRIVLETFRSEDTSPAHHVFGAKLPPELRLDPRAEKPLTPLQEFLAHHAGRVLLAVDSPGRREVLGELLRGAGLKAAACEGWFAFVASEARLALTVAPELAGLVLVDPALTVLPESQLFGTRA
ncbi:MAG: transcription-repair coupling factor, partial [Gammaproteobacteria bacterium]|nr:transcription-repair coupling factor [Gammaproteobacteria bacterium]